MKHLYTRLIQVRNPDFKMHEAVTGKMLWSFGIQTLCQLLRGLKVILRGRSPKMMMLGTSVKFRYFSSIQYGRMLKAGDHVLFSALGIEGIQLGNNVSIGSYSQIIASTSLNQPGIGIQIGDRVGMGEFAYLGGGGGLKIGSDCIIGQYFSCHPENHVFSNPEELIRLQGVTRKGIEIGSGCWIGSKVTILDGAHIGNHCVVAAGAVVTGHFPDYAVIGGVPARILKQRDQQSAA
ncbi:MAG TPA: acyltransferase [Flavobacteriales bacterium]|nr:acyltransferase [Flavobacteriales bacterium]